MSLDCLLFLANDSPLQLAMERILTPETGIRAVRSVASNFEGLLREVCDSNSQVVILEDAIVAGEESSTLPQMLMLNPALKIIVVLSDSNYVRIFRKDEILIRSAADFLEIIHSK